MLNTPHEIEEFKQFQAAGGLKLPETRQIGAEVKSLSASVSAKLKASIDPGVDYERDGIKSLPDAITSLASEADKATSACAGWVSYIDIAAVPTDIEQVSIGVDILRKLAGEPNNSPVPSLLPITSKTEINELKAAMESLIDKEPSTSSLMAQINEALQPIPGTPDPMEPNAPVEDLPPPPLPADLKQKAIAKANELKSLIQHIQGKVSVISSMVSSAHSERDEALKAFSDCIGFTLVSGQRDRLSVSDAANEIFPS